MNRANERYTFEKRPATGVLLFVCICFHMLQRSFGNYIATSMHPTCMLHAFIRKRRTSDVD